MPEQTPNIPGKLPFLEAISWYDCRPLDLPPKDMLTRYEASWRFCGVLCDLSEEERKWVRYLVECYGSTIDP